MCCLDATTTPRHVRKRDVLKSPVLENCTPGPVRGTPGNGRPYLDLLASSRLPRRRVQDAFISKQRSCGAFSVAHTSTQRPFRQSDGLSAQKGISL